MNEQHETPVELLPVEASLEAIAKADRSAAGPGFEQRIFLLTAARLAPDAQTGASAAAGSAETLRMPRRRLRPAVLGLAASVAIGAGVWAMLSGTPGGTPVAPVVDAAPKVALVTLEKDLDVWLEMTEDPYQEEFDLLFAQTAVLSDKPASAWFESELTEEM